MIKSMTLCQSDQIAQIVWIIYVRIDWRLVKVDHVYRFYVNRFWFIVLKCVILVVFISMTNIFLSEATRWIFYI